MGAGNLHFPQWLANILARSWLALPEQLDHRCT